MRSIGKSFLKHSGEGNDSWSTPEVISYGNIMLQSGNEEGTILSYFVMPRYGQNFE